MEIYARPGTIEIERRRFSFSTGACYRVHWLDPDGHKRSTRCDLMWGPAFLLADCLEHGEPYVREEWIN